MWNGWNFSYIQLSAYSEPGFRVENVLDISVDLIWTCCYE